MPKNWKTYKFEELYNIASGLSKSRDQFGFGHPFVTFKDVFYNWFLPEELGDLANTNEKEQKKGGIKKGDIILTRTSETLHELGMSSVALKDYPNSTFNGFCKRLRQKDESSIKIEPVFMAYFLRSHYFRNEVSKYATMTTRASLNIAAINSLSITLPPFNEQQKIASILKPLDDKIENNLAMNKTLEEMAMALYKHWFVDFGPFKDGKFIDSELGKIPEGWEVKGLLEIVGLLTGGTPKTKIEEYWNGNIKWVSAKDLGNNGSIYTTETERTITPKGIEKSAAKILPEDSTIIVARGSVGKMGMLAHPMAINQSCFGLYPKDNYSPGIIYLLICKLVDRFQRISYGSVFDTITTSAFSTTQVISPPKQLIEELGLSIDPMFKTIKENTLENKTLAKLRDTLLPKLISGEVRLKEFEEKLTAPL
ncbi:restriction endonuclease subunit S [Zobellia galactanivorans]|uniref:Type I restriction enzyme ZgaDII, S subunit n=1 Tax=Zobellia galactanivorans (strain DSM 12802 / CCUG 47099 / CIP 106680 / NCIMB 13871 / Dsij) TaxID=63186 RepID=G0LB06_ZOBGA|nr:restriction endonuclease subunit S [Zobellia galactanivorans]CAZ95710.1 Type I restriction enzyme ZgaDII, S subunit [Zobellia galactanivorans]